MHSTAARAMLGVPASANSDSIKRAFRRRALSVHPDHGGTKEAFQALVEAQRVALAGAARGSVHSSARRWFSSDEVVRNRVHHVDFARRPRSSSAPTPKRSFADALAKAMAAA